MYDTEKAEALQKAMEAIEKGNGRGRMHSQDHMDRQKHLQRTLGSTASIVAWEAAAEKQGSASQLLPEDDGVLAYQLASPRPNDGEYENSDAAQAARRSGFRFPDARQEDDGEEFELAVASRRQSRMQYDGDALAAHRRSQVALPHGPASPRRRSHAAYDEDRADRQSPMFDRQHRHQPSPRRKSHVDYVSRIHGPRRKSHVDYSAPPTRRQSRIEYENARRQSRVDYDHALNSVGRPKSPRSPRKSKVPHMLDNLGQGPSVARRSHRASLVMYPSGDDSRKSPYAVPVRRESPSTPPPLPPKSPRKSTQFDFDFPPSPKSRSDEHLPRRLGHGRSPRRGTSYNFSPPTSPNANDSYSNEAGFDQFRNLATSSVTSPKCRRSPRKAHQEAERAFSTPDGRQDPSIEYDFASVEPQPVLPGGQQFVLQDPPKKRDKHGQQRNCDKQRRASVGLSCHYAPNDETTYEEGEAREPQNENSRVTVYVESEAEVDDVFGDSSASSSEGEYMNSQYSTSPRVQRRPRLTTEWDQEAACKVTINTQADKKSTLR